MTDDRGAESERDASAEEQSELEARELAELEDGTRAPEGTPDEQLYYPSCFRDASELRPQATEPEAGL